MYIYINPTLIERYLILMLKISWCYLYTPTLKKVTYYFVEHYITVFKLLGCFRTWINIKFTQIRYRLRSNLKVILCAISFLRITLRVSWKEWRVERLLFTLKLTPYQVFQEMFWIKIFTK